MTSGAIEVPRIDIEGDPELEWDHDVLIIGRNSAFVDTEKLEVFEVGYKIGCMAGGMRAGIGSAYCLDKLPARYLDDAIRIARKYGYKHCGGFMGAGDDEHYRNVTFERMPPSKPKQEDLSDD